MERLEEEQTHLNMFVGAVQSPTITDSDVACLYDLLLKDYSDSPIIPVASQEFQRRRPAAMMDYCRTRLNGLNDPDCVMLMRQLDDAETDDESVAMTLGVLRNKLRSRDYVAAFALAVQVRPESVRIAHRQMAGSARSAIGMVVDVLSMLEDLLGGGVIRYFSPARRRLNNTPPHYTGGVVIHKAKARLI